MINNPVKNLCLALGLLASLCACDKPSKTESETAQDFAVVLAEIEKNDRVGNGNMVIAQGELGDFIIRLAETDQLLAIMQKDKNAMFLSIETPQKYISDGYCLVNVVPLSTLEAIGTPDSGCNYRLFCGSESDMKYDEMYAIELCQ
jgi:hypothetical protein